MACIIYYQNLDYDQLPTARKKARLTPALADASNSFNATPPTSNSYPRDNSMPTRAPENSYSADSNYASNHTTPFNATSNSYPRDNNYSSSKATANSRTRDKSFTSSRATSNSHSRANNASHNATANSNSNYNYNFNPSPNYNSNSRDFPLSPVKEAHTNSHPRDNNYTSFTPASDYQRDEAPPIRASLNPHAKEFSFCPTDSATLHTTLKKYFNFESFRTNQLEAVLATCQGLDTLILMPTGGGKSICYQLPAILSQGVIIVVSPLRSLIEDQVNRLKSLRIPTSALFGETSEIEATNINNDLRTKNPRHKMLYVTPEKIGASGALTHLFNIMHNNGTLARFVIDEAHCVSMWGSDFRPDYRKLGKLRDLWPDVPIMALTATAPPKVRDDIFNQLKMNKATGKTFIQSFNRPNLKFEVRTKTKGCIVDICNLIRKDFKGQCGIIYCLSRNDCEQVAQNLRDQGITSAPYHAGLSDVQRKRVFQAWSSGVFQVVCATIAFGMGIDKSDVRFVVHYSVPKSVEGYYQEAGRAGRDGKFASCILFFSKSDLYRMRSMLSKGRKAEDKERDKTNLEHMISYVDNKSECRRSILLRYLGEQFNSSNCISQFRTACDNCLARNKSNSSYHEDDFIDDE